MKAVINNYISLHYINANNKLTDYETTIYPFGFFYLYKPVWPG